MFSELGLHERLLKALQQQKIVKPTAVQRQAIPSAIKGKDLLVSSETGSGKTAAYVLPILQRFLSSKGPPEGTRALILAPTRELARQIMKSCEALSAFTQVKCALISGGEDYKYQRAVLRKDPEILIATPGRLKEHIEQGATLFDNLEILVLDEADRMLEMGFQDDVTAIVDECNPKRQSLLLSATLDQPGIKEMASVYLNDPELIQIRSASSEQSTIVQQIILADDIKHKERLLLWLVENQPFTKLLVFSNTKAQANRLRGILRGKKQRAATLHSEMKQAERTSTMAAFRTGSINVLVATDVASRGLDVGEIDLVINFDLSRNTDDHVHRIGRTGRAGKAGLAISFVTAKDWNHKASIERFYQTQFEHRTIKALVGAYKGPKKLKSSGKAAGSKKAKLKQKAASKTGKKIAPKARASSTAKKTTLIDGFAPIKKKKPK